VRELVATLRNELVFVNRWGGLWVWRVGHVCAVKKRGSKMRCSP
jgi:hypothetical protein